MSMLLTVKEVSQRLKISASLAYSLIAKGDLPSYQIGSCRRVSEEDLDRFLDERRHEPTQLPIRQHRHF
ncbi:MULTISPECIES: helix-turn-helix domain-containing protein [Rhodopirellula]|uniref:Protein containing Excisionase/Xis, DNA-binding domain protein n=1 Tax=Rhodopirellula baltica SWK14 TaxID=993516 RepID=L7CLB1_RHOBT|nr:helix-turn-helix domain-containing protein [Rhodopirellula baltica]ELP34640.1 protein containing Excisionase/Xis, DNA-binding domain protein [Rhodopirellula baltica SWK14]